MKSQQTGDKSAKTAVVTLRAGGSTLMLLATRKADGNAVTTVTAKDGDKKSRGMSEQHASMDAAKAHLATLAKKAEGLGWQRRVTLAKADAFSTLPPAPKAATTGKK